MFDWETAHRFLWAQQGVQVGTHGNEREGDGVCERSVAGTGSLVRTDVLP